MWEGFGGKRGAGSGALVLSRLHFGQIFESLCGAWGGREGGRESGRVADVGRLLGEAWCGDRSSGLGHGGRAGGRAGSYRMWEGFCGKCGKCIEALVFFSSYF